MKNIISRTLIAIMLVLGLSFVALPSVGSVASAAAPTQADCDNGNAAACIGLGADKTQGAAKKGDLMGTIRTVVNAILMILGAVAVIMIVIGGIRYVTSGGDSNNIKSAKDTILYAVIGLVVAILAYAIVNFVVTAFV